MSKIDLYKNQLVEGDVKVKCWDECKENYRIGYLALIDHRNDIEESFFVWDEGLTGAKSGYHYDCDVTGYKNIELIEPKYRVKDFYSLVETLKEEGFQQREKTSYLLESVHDSGRYLLNWIKLLKLCGKVLSKSEVGEQKLRESWVEEVTE